MKLWLIPWPWDYHKDGAVVVMAETKELALEKAKLHVACRVGKQDGAYCYEYSQQLIKYDEIAEIESGIFDGGRKEQPYTDALIS